MLQFQQHLFHRFFVTNDIMCCALWHHLSSLLHQFSIFEDVGVNSPVVAKSVDVNKLSWLRPFLSFLSGTGLFRSRNFATMATLHNLKEWGLLAYADFYFASKGRFFCMWSSHHLKNTVWSYGYFLLYYCCLTILLWYVHCWLYFSAIFFC